MPSKRHELPLVYACSGCSNVAQIANHVAVYLDHHEIAEMSCIAGVGGEVAVLVRVARSGRPIIALDGCPLQCVRCCLQRVGVEPTWHHVLTRQGLSKRLGPFRAEDAESALQTVLEVMGRPREEPLEQQAPGGEP